MRPAGTQENLRCEIFYFRTLSIASIIIQAEVYEGNMNVQEWWK